MRTIIELPSTTLRRAMAAAASRGITLQQFITEALDEKLRRGAATTDGSATAPVWMMGFGELSDLALENRRIEAIIEAEFETLSPDNIG